MYDTRSILQDLGRNMAENRSVYASENKVLIREQRNSKEQIFFLAIEPLEEKRMLIIPIFKQMGNLYIKQFPLCKGTRVERVPFDKLGFLHNQDSIIIKQTSSDYETFEAFLVSLLYELWDCSAAEVFVAVQQTLQRWHDFFSKVGEDGLSSEQRRGLYGELYFLRGLIRGGVNKGIVTYWRGPYRDSVDFRIESIGIEVKTTTTYKPTKVKISSEDQLTADDLKNMFLYVLSLKVSTGYGESLEQIIGEIEYKLKDWPGYLKSFREALFAAGYHELQAERYRTEKYIVLHTEYFNVKNNFPRLIISDLPSCIANVQYDLILDGLREHIVQESQIIEMIQGL